MDDKPLVTMKKDLVPCLKIGKWKLFGRLHLKLNHWSHHAHSKPELLKCYGGWVRIGNLPLIIGRISFLAIGQQLGGLLSISSQTLNCLNCSSSIIKLERNFCGFIPASLDIKDFNLGKFSITFEA